MPGLLGPISASAASAIDANQSLQNGTYINFGAGYIDAPSSFDTKQTASPTSSASAGGSGLPSATLTENDKTILWVVAGIGIVGLMGVAAFLVLKTHH